MEQGAFLSRVPFLNSTSAMDNMKISAWISWAVTLIWLAFIAIGDEGLMDLHGMELGISDDFGSLFFSTLIGLVVIWGIWLLFKNKIDEKFD